MNTQKIMSLYYFIYFVAMAATSPFLSLYLHGKGINDTDIGILLAIGSVIGIISQPVLGYLNDYSNDPRKLLAVSIILSPIMFAGYALFTGFWPLFAVSILLASVQSITPVMDAIAIKEGELSGFTYGQIRLWGALGFALSTVAAGYAYHIVGIKASFIVYGVLTVFLILNTVYLPKPANLVHTPKEIVFKGILNVARQKALLIFILICFLLTITSSVNYSFLPLYYEDLHYPMSLVGLNYTVAALVEVPFFYLSGKAIEHFGVMRIVIVGSLLYAIKYAWMAFAPGATIVITIQTLDGVAYALYWSASVQFISDLAPANRTATAQTLYGAIAGSLSGIFGTIGGGFVLEHFGPLVMYGCIATLATVATCCFLVFAKWRSAQNAQAGKEFPI
jgi:MFS transporter, PPP family, 3-phenylpropionic acid transporter